MSQNLWVFVIAAALVVGVLACTAVYYLFKLHRLRKAQGEKLLELERRGQQQRERVNKSIQVIASAVDSDDITLTEASIRISVLLDGIDVEPGVKEEFSAFYQLREATAHIPILDAWKSLPRKEQMQYDKERVKHERDFESFVQDAARRIRGREF